MADDLLGVLKLGTLAVVHTTHVILILMNWRGFLVLKLHLRQILGDALIFFGIHLTAPYLVEVNRLVVHIGPCEQRGGLQLPYRQRLLVDMSIILMIEGRHVGRCRTDVSLSSVLDAWHQLAIAIFHPVTTQQFQNLIVRPAVKTRSDCLVAIQDGECHTTHVLPVSAQIPNEARYRHVDSIVAIKFIPVVVAPVVRTISVDTIGSTTIICIEVHCRIGEIGIRTILQTVLDYIRRTTVFPSDDGASKRRCSTCRRTDDFTIKQTVGDGMARRMTMTYEAASIVISNSELY